MNIFSNSSNFLNSTICECIFRVCNKEYDTLGLASVMCIARTSVRVGIERFLAFCSVKNCVFRKFAARWNVCRLEKKEKSFEQKFFFLSRRVFRQFIEKVARTDLPLEKDIIKIYYYTMFKVYFS